MRVEVDVLRDPRPNSQYGLCGRKATLNKKPTRVNERHTLEL